ncbi:MAG: hypothetical protein ACI35Q_07505 [Marinilabiliaceae bacterium]
MKMYKRGADSDSRPKTPFVPDGTTSLRSISLEDVVFVNVEGVPELTDYDNLTPEMKSFWESTQSSRLADGATAESLYSTAGEVPEFGKVASITAGVVRRRGDDESPYFVTTSYVGDDERSLLSQFSVMIDKFFSDKEGLHYLCGHGIWQRDVPFLAKRMLINGLPLPALFDSNGRRPLRAQLVDTAEFWTFSDHSASRVSAPLLAAVFGLDAEASDFNPAEAARLFREDDTDALQLRSERKALLYAQLLLRFRGEGVIDPSHVVRKV